MLLSALKTISTSTFETLAVNDIYEGSIQVLQIKVIKSLDVSMVTALINQELFSK